MRVWVGGVGVLGPGLAGWEGSRAALAGTKPYASAPTLFAPISSLPPAERRRLGVPVKLALQAGLEAFANAGRDPAAAATVFTSSGGDGENVHAICSTLASSDRALSPTRFHNAVHNAAAGYWSITTGSQAASTSLCCHDASFAAGLLEAAVQVTTSRAPVAVIAYDHTYPEPLRAVRPIGGDFAVALVLLPQSEGSALAALDIDVVRSGPCASPLSDPGLEALRMSVSAARALPLLVALLHGAAEVVVLDYLDTMRLRVAVTSPAVAIMPFSSEQPALARRPPGT